MEIVHEGWLIKSPPEKRIWRAKWRRRWFVLRHSGQIPGQYLLEYYTDTSCKKQKGKIDLDQCEQVDAGLAFESRKLNYRFMFDIRTPKRIYLLVAETEGEMNKWVDCICAVCGLKMHADEEPPPAEQMSLTVTNQPTQSSTSLDGSFFAEETSLDSPTSPSGPYIPISECTTGKAPLVNGSYLTLNRFNTGSLDDAPPPPPPKSDRGYVGETYDQPRQIHPPSLGDLRTSPDPNTEELYKVPPLLRTPTTPSDRDVLFGDDEWTPSMPPKVNWDTYPLDSDGPDSPFHSGSKHSEVCADKVSSSSLPHKLHRVHISSASDGHHPREIYENVSIRRDSTSDTDCHNSNSRFVAPPRPPKPAHLVETAAPHNSYQNITLNTKVMPSPNNFQSTLNSYDVPPPSSQSTCVVGKNPTVQIGSFKQDNDCNTESSQTCVPSPVHLDEMYDFPRPMQDDKLSAMPPAPPQSLTRQRKHLYTNAPAGYTGDVFTYEIKPIQNAGENYLSMASHCQRFKPSDVYTDMSGDNRSPSAVYTNLPSPMLKVPPGSTMPPAVHRDLKPKRRLTVEDGIVHSRSCSSASSTDVSAKSPSPVEGIYPPAVHRDLKPKRTIEESSRQNLLTLAPPPVCRIRSTNNKRSFRKPKTSVSPTPSSHHHHHHHRGGKYSTVPSNNRRSDQSSSDDDHSSSGGSRRNSDDQHQRFFPKPISGRPEPEIQYLDLDLDADTVQSPKSPERPTTSTVYKTVDFVKTKAFNEMRQNVEETYRKSQ